MRVHPRPVRFPQLVTPRLGFDLSLRQAHRYTGERAALVGDAAHTVSASRMRKGLERKPLGGGEGHQSLRQAYLSESGLRSRDAASVPPLRGMEPPPLGCGIPGQVVGQPDGFMFVPRFQGFLLSGVRTERGGIPRSVGGFRSDRGRPAAGSIANPTGFFQERSLRWYIRGYAGRPEILHRLRVMP